MATFCALGACLEKLFDRIYIFSNGGRRKVAWMSDPFGGERKGRWRQRLLEIDGWIDSSLHDLGHGAGGAYERIVTFMRRFRAEGFSRALSELASESFT